MIRLHTAAEARAWTAAQRAAGRRVGLIATMGALHQGHLAHVPVARAHAQAVVLSVFVNPTQFGPGEDLGRYPRDLERDAALAAEAGVDALFAPPVTEMYPEGQGGLFLEPGPLARLLEGAVRPDHFRGVATVVAKLLALLSPDVATFGQKDAQQLVVVRRVARGLLLPVEIACVPTVREPDGLALSSRNVYLSAAERAAAPALYRALQAACTAAAAGERQVSALEAAMRRVLGGEPLILPNYATVVAATDLTPLERLQGRVLLLVAARLGGTRLLDNLCLEIDEHGVRQSLL